MADDNDLKVVNKKKSGEKKRFKIKVDRDLCTGISSCIAIAPDVFELDDETKAVLKNGEYVEDYSGVADYDTIMAAAMSCPPKAIIIIDEKSGDQVFPV